MSATVTSAPSASATTAASMLGVVDEVDAVVVGDRVDEHLRQVGRGNRVDVAGAERDSRTGRLGSLDVGGADGYDAGVVGARLDVDLGAGDRLGAERLGSAGRGHLLAAYALDAVG